MKEYKPNLTLIYDEDLCIVLGQKYNITPCDMLRSMDGRLCGAFKTSATLQGYIAEYEAGATLVNLQDFRAHEQEVHRELERSGV